MLVDPYDAYEKIGNRSFLFGNVEMSQASSSLEESVITKLNRLIKVVEKKFKNIKDQMSLLEEENNVA